MIWKGDKASVEQIKKFNQTKPLFQIKDLGSRYGLLHREPNGYETVPFGSQIDFDPDKKEVKIIEPT